MTDSTQDDSDDECRSIEQADQAMIEIRNAQKVLDIMHFYNNKNNKDDITREDITKAVKKLSQALIHFTTITQLVI